MHKALAYLQRLDLLDSLLLPLQLDLKPADLLVLGLQHMPKSW